MVWAFLAWTISFLLCFIEESFSRKYSKIFWNILLDYKILIHISVGYGMERYFLYYIWIYSFFPRVYGTVLNKYIHVSQCRTILLLKMVNKFSSAVNFLVRLSLLLNSIRYEYFIDIFAFINIKADQFIPKFELKDLYFFIWCKKSWMILLIQKINSASVAYKQSQTRTSHHSLRPWSDVYTYLIK